MVEIDVALHRGDFALRANLHLEDPVTGLFGPSGSGKSTLLGVISGNVKPDSGRIFLNGRCLLDTRQGIDVPIHQRRIGMVFQDSRLFPHLTVKGNLSYGLDLLRKNERQFSLEQITELLEIGKLLSKRPRQLSGGEQQRVALGRALLSSPSLLLLDEPLASLDERLKGQILPFLYRVKEETRIPMIYVSHSINEILSLTPTLAIIDGGAILAHGSFHEVLKADKALALAHSLGIDNIINVRLTESHEALGYCLGAFAENSLFLPFTELAMGTSFSVMVPATNIALSKTPIAAITIQNQIPGTVTSIRIFNHRALVSVNTGQTLIAEISEKALKDLDIKKGDQVFCLFKSQAIRPLGRTGD